MASSGVMGVHNTFVIQHGHVIDPANGLDQTDIDVFVEGGRIRQVGHGLSVHGDVPVVDATGLFVTPGLVDMHVHAYEACTPIGVNVDDTCLGRGVTTVVDAGSAGAGTFEGLRKFIINQSSTRVLAFLHIAAHGLAAAGCAGFGLGGECDSLKQVNVDACVETLRRNPDVLVGVKVRLTADVANDGQYEMEVFRRALSAARQVRLPLMTHHTISTIPTQAAKDDEGLCCPGDLEKGDIYTHAFHGYQSTIVDEDSRRLHDDVIAARHRGVLFDVGHGQGSFSWPVAETAAAEGFWPDLISTDMHSTNKEGPVYDLPCVMTKFLHLGMPLYDVIQATTETPARALNRLGEFGSLSVDSAADITLLRLGDVPRDLEDSVGQVRRVQRDVTPLHVWRNGQQFSIRPRHQPYPNTRKYTELAEHWSDLVIRDHEKPCCN